MRLYLVSLLVLSACGNDNSGGSSGGPKYEVASFTMSFGACTTGAGATCPLFSVVTLANDVAELPEGFHLVIQGSPNVDQPAACDANSTDLGAALSFTLPIPAEPSRTISQRACVLDVAAGTYSAGVAATASTPAIN